MYTIRRKRLNPCALLFRYFQIQMNKAHFGANKAMYKHSVKAMTNNMQK